MACATPCTRPSTTSSATWSGPGPEKTVARSTRSGRRTASSRDVWRRPAASRACSAWTSTEEYGGGGVRDFRFNAVLDEEMVRIGASGLGFGLHNDVVAPVPARPGHRGAEAALAARVLHRRADHRHRDDRAGRRQRPAGHPDHGAPGRRRLRPQRLEDVHHQRHQRRPGHRRRARPTPRRRAPRASACSWSSGTCPASPAAGSWRRSASRRRTPRSCSSTTCGCRPRTCSAPRTAASTT